MVVSFGPADVAQTLRQTLAMGADRGILVAAEDKELDSLVIARALKAIVDKEKPDLVLMGKQVVDGDSNAVGQMLAELLGWPMATFAMNIATSDGGKTLTVGREVDTGVLTLKVKAPGGGHRRPAHRRAGSGQERRHARHAQVQRRRALRLAQGHHAGEEEADRAGHAGQPRRRHRAQHIYAKFELPPARSGSVTFVENVDQLIHKLHNEAKLI